ncbi:hypothetical protein MTR_8g096490 [Medicago truncatula]|uniref:Uncharacterized protein n=1 Tax=Medicago truncatula TaxID=3880 RepID=A0A072TVV3_MEDTR|nr:hypothetical protein MTR_8g096490 [Medicago truncatula]
MDENILEKGIHNPLVSGAIFGRRFEDVDNEYGYKSDGPLWLPCDVELFFCEALMEIEASQVVDDISFVGCSFPLSHKHSPVSNSSLSCCSSNPSFNVNYQVLV